MINKLEYQIKQNEEFAAITIMFFELMGLTFTDEWWWRSAAQ